MSDKRIEDTSSRINWLRSDRMIEQNREWFFQTREGTFEGPFNSRLEASLKMDSYLKAVTSGLLLDEESLKLMPLPD